MRAAASPCWNFLIFLWAFLNSSVQKMCFSYEIQVPENYTALSGDLEVTIIGLLRTVSEDVRLELLEVENVPTSDKNLEKRDTTNSETGLRIIGGPLIKFVDTRNQTGNSSQQQQEEEEEGRVVSPSNGSPETEQDRPLESLSRVLGTKDTQIPHIRVDKKWTVLGSVIVPVNKSENGRIVKVKFPCGVITRGGHFGVRLTGHNANVNNLTRRHRVYKHYRLESNPRIEEIGSNLSIVGLDVRWPSSILSISPRHVETYPDVPVTAFLQFLPTKCSPAQGAPIPEMWLDLLFCGHSLVGCIEGNSTHRQVVYSEQIRGYPKRRVIVLRCELFGSAGHFALSLRSSVQTGTVIDSDNKDAYLKAVWSEHYIFNVHARSIFPCDVHGGGVPVLFQYPKCILKGDRVRLYSRLRADVSSLVPPTSLHYVTEQRVVKGKHSLHFDCDLFSEKYVEYCFVYVSQAITGAVSDVRMDCVPTLPVYDSDSGNWGAWNPWSPCSSTCGGGTRNRFRYCDSPPPKYGAKFCEGSSVETERCGNANWDCDFYQSYPSIASGIKGTDFPANRPEIVAEVGPGCRCGCVVHLGAAKPRRLLATSSQSCPGRIFWQIEADSEHVIRFSVEHFRFPCSSQWLKVRDGDSRTSTLIGELSRSHTTSVPVISSGPKLLVEFFSDELLASGQECWGGFLAHAQQSRRPFSNTSSVSSGFSISNILRNMEVAPTATTSLFIIHCFVALFVCLVIFISGCLGIQYILRYRKYQLAAAAEDAESTGGDSQSSLVAVRSRATSNSTLLSEVISLQRFKPAKKYKHSRLREEEPEMEEEQLSESSDSQPEDDNKTPTSSLKTLKPEADDSSNSTPVYSRKSPSSVRCYTPDESSDNQASQSFLKQPRKSQRQASSPETAGNSSSLDSTFSKEGVRKFFQRRRQSLSSSSVKSGNTLTNDGYSPCSSIRSVGTRNPKAKKEKRNLEKLLAGSEFSLPEDADLELDYYDYNVQNASAVPESYIGMDPAYLVWIPPFSPVDWDEDADKNSEKIDDENIELNVYNNNNNNNNNNNGDESEKEEETVEKWRASPKRENEELTKDLVSDYAGRGTTTPNGNAKGKSVVRKTLERGRYTYSPHMAEKETRVEKSPSDGSDYYRVIEDIKYADDDDEDLKIDNGKCDIYASGGKSVKRDNGHVKT